MYGPAGGCRGNTDLCRAVLAGTMRKVAGAACNGANCGVNGIAAAACGEGCAVKLASVGGSCCGMKKSLPENLIVLKSAYYVEKSYICL